jgi:hypothetical protein
MFLPQLAVASSGGLAQPGLRSQRAAGRHLQPGPPPAAPLGLAYVGHRASVAVHSQLLQ